VTADVPPPTAGSVAADRFPPHSRYAACEVVTSTDPDGIERRHLRRRFIPDQESLTTVAQHLIVAGDHLDLLAQRYYGDPLLSWRIADANRAQDPSRLVEDPGRVLRVTAPDGSGGFGGFGGFGGAG
jgi:nucleoid-associated protein YgaU